MTYYIAILVMKVQATKINFMIRLMILILFMEWLGFYSGYGYFKCAHVHAGGYYFFTGVNGAHFVGSISWNYDHFIVILLCIGIYCLKLIDIPIHIPTPAPPTSQKPKNLKSPNYKTKTNPNPSTCSY